MTEKEIIQFCCAKIEEVFEYGSSSEWTHYHFKTLSDQIEEKTGVIVSPTTLKRLFGKRSTESDYVPQISTRNALAQFAGFNSWHELTQSVKLQRKTFDSKDTLVKKNKSSYLSRNVIWGIAFILAVASTIALVKFLSNHSFKNPDLHISVRNNVDTVPFTAIFDYTVPSNLKDTFSLNIPGLGNTPLSSGNEVFTHWFNYSGYFRIPIVYKNSLVRTVNVFALNRDWQPGIYQEDEIRPFKPFTNPNLSASQNGMLYISPSQLQQCGIDSLSNYMLEFRYFNFFDLSLDNFSFETIARNSYSTGGKPCFDIDIELVGENGKIRCVFTQEKCFRFSQLTVGDVNVNGKNSDLSMFSHDISNWTAFNIEAKSQIVHFSINDEIIYTQQYSSKIGNLKGIIFRFFGSGQAKSIEIYDKNGDLCFKDNFTDSMSPRNKKT